MSASCADRIPRGEKVGELPAQWATTCELLLNMKTAKAMSLAIPPRFSPAPAGSLNEGPGIAWQSGRRQTPDDQEALECSRQVNLDALDLKEVR
jgi:hypothetical protein